MNHDEILNNRAELNNLNSEKCKNCENPVLFALKDNYHEFSVDMSTILKCLKMAETECLIPELPKSWWRAVSSSYRL